MRKYLPKLFSPFNTANNNIKSTFKLKRKLDWCLELISVMYNEIQVFSSFLKDRSYTVVAEVTKLNNRNYCFFRGHGNESCNLIGSLPGQYFPISAHGPR